MTTPTAPDWTYIASLTGEAYERAIAAATGIRAEPDAYGHVTGQDARHVVSVDMTDGATLALLETRGHGSPVVSTVRDVVRDAAREVATVRDALVLSQVMHGDVLAASGRVVATRLSDALTGDASAVATREVRAALVDALLPVADAIADHGRERAATVRRAPVTRGRGPLYSERGAVLPADATLTGTRAYVSDLGSDVSEVGHTDAGEPLYPWHVYATARERRDAARAARDAAASVRTWSDGTGREYPRECLPVAGDARGHAFPGRRTPVLLDSLGYPYALGYEPVTRPYGPVRRPTGTRVPMPWLGNGATGRLATSLTRDLGAGYTLTPGTRDRERDALGRVSLASGWTISPERLASPLTSERRRAARVAPVTRERRERADRLAAFKVGKR